MDPTDSEFNVRRRRRFCHDLYRNSENRESPEVFIEPKAKYMTECLRTFLKHDLNFYGLELLDRIENVLEPFMGDLQRDAVHIGVMFLLTSSSDRFFNVNDEQTKKIFGQCPFNVLQSLKKMAESLKKEMSQEQLDFMLGKRKNSSKLWSGCDSQTLSPHLVVRDCIPDYFFIEMSKPEEKEVKCDSSFSMSYKEPPKGKEVMDKDWFENAFVKYNILPGFTSEEFYRSLFQILSSNRSNDEIQNELFEMLGFDAFQLIAEILDNRRQIVEQGCSFDAPSNSASKRPIDNGYMKNKLTPALSSQVIVQSEEEKLSSKQMRKLEKKAEKDKLKNLNRDFDSYTNYQNGFESKPKSEEQPSLPKISRSSMPSQTYPHVHDEQQDIQMKAMVCGQLTNVPFDAERKSTNEYDQITIPPRPSTAKTSFVPKIKISSMDKIGRMVFNDIETFNSIQSEVYPVAYHTNENMLICAPTGAGKTNIALLTIVQQIKSFLENDVVRLDRFKIVYVCPMKALAAEMAANFSRKLAPLGIQVKELTGDMQLTRKEITETQMLITTPEKWDVISRKGTTDAELTSLLKLLILDEVHLLNSDRGPVIEALVARTLRQVVNSQNMIRIVGLSATLPNYLDIAHFLRVNPEVGLFYFDSRYRSVPLTQVFIGIKSTKQAQANVDTDETCFLKVVEFLRAGHQVMVFVHARNQTNRTATFLKETASKKGVLHLFEPDKSFRAKKATWSVKNKSLESLLPFGLWVHHAGMLRRDRTEVERCFVQGAIKVLVCTATLAWGVNLPAHGVIIKGTRLYDSKKCAFVDLDILDVLQIFGRAGRPQYDTSGTGVIITGLDKMNFYLSALTNQIPIESKLLNALSDNLNAEIVLGSISNIQEAVEWMTFTYLYRRMRINPQVYGLQYSDLQEDPDLREALLSYTHKAAKSLDKAHMIRYDPKNGDLMSTNLGRTASYYYINFDTMEVFNDMMNPAMTISDILSMMCLASEFQQIQVRQEELEDLDVLMDDYCEMAVPGGPENVHGKVNILMQTYLSKGFIKSLSLSSDMEYITQSAARIARSLFDISIHQNKALLSGRCLIVAQMFEQQIWPHQTPLRQFKYLEAPIIDKIEQHNTLNIYAIRDMDEKQIGQIIKNVKAASKVKHCADAFPLVEVDSVLQPITRGVIRVKLSIKPTFKWSNVYHGKACESFWVWIEDPDNDCIYHTESCTITKNAVVNEENVELVFTVPLIEPRPSQYLVRISSDRWIHAVHTHPLSFMDLKLPQSFTPHTDLLELQPLEVRCLNNPKYESLYKFSHFNPVQTQIFHCLYHTDNNVLLGAPTGSGKTIAAEICMFRLFNNSPELKIVYIAPLKALVRERVEDWKKKFGSNLGKKIVEITGDVTPSSHVISSANIIITTPEKWDGMSRGWQNRNFIREVGLMVIDEIHLLGEDRGPVLEVIVSRTNFIADRTHRNMRIIGLSTAMANARDLATWLGIGEVGLYNFRPSVRPVPLEVHIAGFPGKHYCPRMMSMNRPTYQAIRQHAPNSPALVFCSSRKQTRLTAFDLITYLVTDCDPKQWLHCDEDTVELIISNVQDVDLKHFLAFGIGIHHAGLQERDRKTVEELFVNQKIQVLIATATLAWGVNFPAHLVVIKGTEYFDGATKRYVDMPITDVLQMMGRAGRPQFDNSGVACVFVHDVKKNFYKKFLYEPFPVESNLLQVLPDHVNAEVAAETVPTKMHLMEYLTWTYFFRRLLENPTYYNLPDVDPQQVNQYLSDLVDTVVNVLENSNCVSVNKEDSGVRYESTFFGRVSSFYYLSHKTMLHFQNSSAYDNGLLEMLGIMCHAEEYAQFPVRHNEDKINMELSKHLNIKMNGLAYDSPHVKVNILLQMYFGDVTLPNQEYIVDLKMVLDQALRILQAMVDISANNGWLSSTLKVIHLMQMMIQGRWLHEPDITTIHLITKPSLPSLHKEFETHAPLRNCLAGTLLCGLKHASVHHERVLNDALINVYGTKQANEIKRQIANIPLVSISLSIVDVESGVKRFIELEQTIKPVTVLPAAEYDLSVQFFRKGTDDKSVVHSTRFPKKKDEGWFLCVGRNDELCGIKRMNIRNRSMTSVRITTPATLGNYVYSLMVMSDSYIGLDHQYEISMHVKN